MSSNSPHRSWCFTENNYTPEQILHYQQLECNYICFGKEVGEKGTPHLQGVIRFAKTHRLTGIKKTISQTAHWEPCRDFEKAVNYCMKEDPEPFIKDNRKQGQRTDLDLACETVQTGGILELAKNDPGMFVKYHGGFTKLATMFQKPRKEPPHVTWIYGTTGTGKTRLVHDKEDSLFVAHSSYKWWDGYRQQDAIIIDDMRASWAPFNILLKILDRYQMQVEVKGGFCELNSPRIYITSQFPPHEVYNREHRSGEDIAQLLRRVTSTLKMTLSPFDGSVVTTAQSQSMLLAMDADKTATPAFSQWFPEPLNLDRSTAEPRRFPQGRRVALSTPPRSSAFSPHSDSSASRSTAPSTTTQSFVPIAQDTPSIPFGTVPTAESLSPVQEQIPVRPPTRRSGRIQFQKPRHRS